MSLLHPGAEDLARRYLAKDSVADVLGSGIDGIVYSTSRGTAIKVHDTQRKFFTERSVYRRLRLHKVESVNGFAIPTLHNSSQKLKIIEISIVRPPFILDFASAHLDKPPDFEPYVWSDWRQKRAEEFEDRWPEALAIFEELRRRWGIYHLDLSPRNVNFGNTE